MKLTISVEGAPAAIDGILGRILEQIRQGDALNFSSTLHPERSLGVEGIVECKSSLEELALWKQGLAWSLEGRAEGLQGQEFDRWLIAKLKATELPEAILIPIFAQLSALEREERQRSGGA